MLRNSLLGLAVLAMMATMFLGLPVAEANTPVRVTINGALLTMDVAPTTQNGRILVPMRDLFEALGAQVHWDAETRTIRAYRREDAIVLELGNRTAWVNGPSRQMEVAPVAIGGRTMVPLRFVAEALGAEVAWVDATRTVTVQHTPYTPKPIGGTLTLGAIAEPGVLNPVFSTDIASLTIHGQTNWGLFRTSADMTPRNMIADRWSWDHANLTWTFWLRPDARFSDGRPLTSRDVKFSFETIMHPDYDGVRRPAMEYVASITTEGDHIVRVTMRQADASFLSKVGFGIIPYHILGQVPVRELRAHAFSRQPIGAGPYLLDRIIPGQFAVLRRNQNFWLAPRPYIETMVIRRYADTNVMQAAFEVGDIDAFNILPDAIERVRREFAGRVNFHEFPGHNYDFLLLNLENPILRDRRVREALILALDRPAIVRSALNDFGIVVHAHQLSPGWASGAPNLNAYAFNPARARQLLDEAGWRIPPGQTFRRRDGSPTGDPMRLSIMWNAAHVIRRDVAAMAVRQWREIGVDAMERPLEGSVLLRERDLGRFDALITNWVIGLDPDPFSFFHSSEAARGADGRFIGLNHQQFRNAEVDRLLEAGRSTLDMAERRAIYHQIDQILNRELPLLWLYQRTFIRGVWNRVSPNVSIETQVGTLFGEAQYIRR